MISSSSLCKNKQVLTRNGGGKMEVIRQLCRQYVTLEHDTFLQFVSGWDIFTLSLCLHGFGKSVCLSFDYQFCHHNLWSYLSRMLPNSRVVSPICSRENPSAVCTFPDPLFQSWFTLIWPSLFCVDDVGFIMTLLRRITSCRLQLIIWEVDLKTPFWYLRACMP